MHSGMMGHGEIAVAVTDRRCGHFARMVKQPRRLAEGDSVMQCSSWDGVCAMPSLKSLQQMLQQYMTAGIPCARVEVSRRRGREGSKNTCECCNETLAMLRSASPVVAESFVTIKACKLTAKQNKQSRYSSYHRRPLPPEV